MTVEGKGLGDVGVAHEYEREGVRVADALIREALELGERLDLLVICRPQDAQRPGGGDREDLRPRTTCGGARRGWWTLDAGSLPRG